MSDKQCIHLVEITKGLHKLGQCDITNSFCGFCRLCKDKNKIVSSPMYGIGGCQIEINYKEGTQMGKTKNSVIGKNIDKIEEINKDFIADEIEENKQELIKLEKKEKINKTKKIEAKVLTRNSAKNTTAIEINNCGIIIKGSYYTPTVIVEYEGELGKEFKIVSVE